MSKGDEFYHNLQKILFPTFSVNQQDVFHSSSRQVEILFTETTLIIFDTENQGIGEFPPIVNQSIPHLIFLQLEISSKVIRQYSINSISWLQVVLLTQKTFFQLFNKTLDRHAPIKESARNKEKNKSKPWTTKGIRKSISIRDKLYKDMIKEKNILTKSLKHESFKKYQNQITNFLRVSKQTL